MLAFEGLGPLPDPDEPGAALCRAARNVILAWRLPSGNTDDRDATASRGPRFPAAEWRRPEFPLDKAGKLWQTPAVPEWVPGFPSAPLGTHHLGRGPGRGPRLGTASNAR